uniref:Uncharacterized protein n=1 Tax=Rhizophora mucronata TaxID=61149 RepID=A0A2P2KMQ4_RHIMU
MGNSFSPEFSMGSREDLRQSSHHTILFQD